MAHVDKLKVAIILQNLSAFKQKYNAALYPKTVNAMALKLICIDVHLQNYNQVKMSTDNSIGNGVGMNDNINYDKS